MNDLIAETPRAVEEVVFGDEPPPARVEWLVPTIIGSALFMQTLDANVISNALPSMARSLHENPLTLNLAITSYLLASAVFLPISGWAADRFGAKHLFRIAIILFAASSLACGLAQNLPQLVAFRMIQGMAGAMMTPVGRVVLLRSTPKAQLVQAMSFLTLPTMLGPVLGPPVGGFLVTYASWRWIFFINIPAAILGVTLVSVFISDVREKPPAPLDWRGFLLTGLGLAGFVYGFENLGRGILPQSVIIGLLGGGAALLGAYAAHSRSARHPILDLSLFKLPTFRASTVGGAFIRLSMGASPFLLALLLQMGFGMTALAAGLLTFTSGVAALAMKATAGPIISRLGFKRVLVGNTVITALTFMAYGLFKIDTPRVLMLAVLLIGGFFRSLQFTALNTLAYADVEPSRMGQASSLSSMGQQLSQSIGVGLAAMLLSAIGAAHGRTGLNAADVSLTFFIIGAASLLGLAFFLPLARDAGAEVSGRRVSVRGSTAVIAQADD
jgi:EmrB/QacA subfamily drug resistance transporter